ncbi:hypothetical protein [Paenibacillus rhizophilus]|uniref:hypothetical protein n=1 Tax=Paenibacillus rhizophilus TaxID=1850366 RepID=UPI00163A154D|nr:hypothetical protein [Paenibacillus rhizophilus]
MKQTLTNGWSLIVAAMAGQVKLTALALNRTCYTQIQTAGGILSIEAKQIE